MCRCVGLSSAAPDRDSQSNEDSISSHVLDVAPVFLICCFAERIDSRSAYRFWRFVSVQELRAKEIQTFLDYPPMQRGASFNLDALEAKMAKRMAEAQAASKTPGH